MRKCLLIESILCALIILTLASCAKKDTKEVLRVKENNSELSEISELANDPAFKDTIHILSNESSGTYTAVTGDGRILVNTMRPNLDNLRIVEDERTKEAKYIAKSLYGEELITKTYEFSDGEENAYKEASIKTIFYDKNGKEIGLTANTHNATLAIGDYIFFNDETYDYNDGTLYEFNVKTKEVKKAIKPNIEYFASHVLFSSDAYGFRNADDVKKEILVCDDDLNVIRTIDDYSFSSAINYDNTVVGVVTKNVIINEGKDYNDMKQDIDYVKMYNYLDEDLNFIFDEPVNSRAYFDESTIVTIHKGDIEFDFDFKTRQKVSDDRPYSGFENNNEYYQHVREQYKEQNERIKSSDDKYNYVETKIYKDKVLFFAYSDGTYDEEKEVYITPCDIYSIDGDLLLSVDGLTATYEDEGFFLVDYKTLYNFDLEKVREFDEKVYIDYIKPGKKTYFIDDKNDAYEEREKFNVYDINMNLICENVDNVINYTYENKLVVIVDGKTKIVDEDFNVIKEIDKRLDIRGWYGDDSIPYKGFTNLDTKRMGVIDSNYNIVVDGLKKVSRLEDKCFTFENGFRYGLMDYSGKEICSLSIFNTMNEDSKASDYDIGYVE